MPADQPVIPDGFYPAELRGKFTTHNGPVYRANMRDDLRSGLHVLDRHCNGMGFLHGGMIAAFSDSALAWAVYATTQKRSLTIKLTLSFLDTVSEGDWLEARPVVDHVDADLVHLHADLVVGPQARPAARADAVFRLLRR